MFEEFDMIWMENLLGIEKIIELMEGCDKQCSNCTKEEKNDCLLEMRESIHSLAIHFKNAIYSFVEECTREPELEDTMEDNPEIYL